MIYRYTMFGFEGCDYCAMLKAYLEEKGLPYDFVAEPDKERRLALYVLWNQEETSPDVKPASSMPQLFMEGIRLGGAQEVMAMPVQWLLDLARGEVDFQGISRHLEGAHA